MRQEQFTHAGIRPYPKKTVRNGKRSSFPYLSALILILIILSCLFAGMLAYKDPAYLDLAHTAQAPSKEFFLGTDNMGRDLFSCLLYGGRISLSIGVLSAFIAALTAFLYGSLSGLANDLIDTVMMRFLEILSSIPNLLLIIFLQAAFGEPDVLSISVSIGLCSWFPMAKFVRTDVRQLRSTGFMTASRAMGAGFLFLFREHLLPNFLPSVLYMALMNIRTAIASEAVLSFMGIGLPVEVISWGSLLSSAQNAMMNGAWWMIVFPGIFLISTMLSITALGKWYENRILARRNGTR